eukprot:TRINITY_DN6188_c0_g2_i2.p1 TRINITY_DN6188_c0_g2~~TRINITY_DN6188_c0_g2_i2.p1  ORF type:complete len:143 (+),score=35.60 TRINITY_DN6188_c0_g2_i2:43-471(+)
MLVKLFILLAAVALCRAQQDACEAKYSAESTCDADAACTWCKCGALPSQCWTLANAAKLPPGVYICDKKEAVAEVKKNLPAPVAVGEDACEAKYSAESTCDADAACTWCKCGALPSQCWTLANAAKLPPGVYICDKNATKAL